MKKLHFTYNMQIEYSIEVADCNFTIKCIPVNTKRQTIDNLKISMYPDTDYQWGLDGLKNKQIWGKNSEPHMSFSFQIEGDALTGLAEYEEDMDTDLAIIFSCAHGLNVPGKMISEFYDTRIKNISTDTFDKVLKITKLLYEEYKYQSGSTNVDTSAEAAFAQGHGVCQDYAHILISLLHLAGVGARYVTGFIIGEGESHAWVEFLYDGRWYGIDPTNNKLVDDDYIKIGHGRDAKDCMINRGIMHGGGQHTQKVTVSVQEV